MNPNLLLAILALALAKLLGLCTYSIPSPSMMPTMAPGDYVVAQRYSSSEAPQRGDIMVFHNPQAGNVEWVKRIIGLPGDRVQLRAGLVYVNGVVLGRRYPDPLASRGDVYVETTPEGRSYHIMKGAARRVRDDTSEIIVPAGHFYVLGDNRDNSADSRDATVGLVARENAVARMQVVYWARSLTRVGTWLE